MGSTSLRGARTVLIELEPELIYSSFLVKGHIHGSKCNNRGNYTCYCVGCLVGLKKLVSLNSDLDHGPKPYLTQTLPDPDLT